MLGHAQATSDAMKITMTCTVHELSKGYQMRSEMRHLYQIASRSLLNIVELVPRIDEMKGPLRKHAFVNITSCPTFVFMLTLMLPMKLCYNS